MGHASREVVTRSDASGPGSARAALRAATRAVHDRLHESALFAEILAGSIDAAGYRRLLLQLYGFHKPLQDALQLAASRCADDFGERIAVAGRAERISEDLMAVDCEPVLISVCPMVTVPSIGSPGHLMGCLYVREGATLGGRVLARRLDHLLASRTRGRLFFAGTADDAALWAETCGEIERVAAAGHLADMIEGACSTFALFEAWIEGGPTARTHGSRP